MDAIATTKKMDIGKEHWVMSVDSRFDKWYAAVKHKLAKESFHVLSDIFFAIATQADSFGGNSEILAHILNTFISQRINHTIKFALPTL